MTKNNALELYDGPLMIKGPDGRKVAEFDGRDYLSEIGEHVEDYSWLKFPFYKKEGWPDGIYRVGPLARLNVADRIGTPLANERLKSFKALGVSVNENLYYHVARTIELLYASERAQELLMDDDIVSKDCRVRADRMSGEGVGVLEAPRGTLFHHYQTDDDGRIIKANFVVATEHNNRAIDLSVMEVAKAHIRQGKLTEGILNRIEMAVRCYDPCLSCSTHAIGRMPLEVGLYAEGRLIDLIRRGSDDGH